MLFCSPQGEGDLPGGNKRLPGYRIKQGFAGLFRNHAWLLLPFLLSVAVWLVVCAWKEIAPFGGNSIFTWDGKDQLHPLLRSLRDMLATGQDVGYSLKSGLGMDELSVYAVHAASPFNLLAGLFPAESSPEAYLAILLLKVGFGAVAFSVYARQALGASRSASVLFSLAWTGIGWLSAYYYHIHFLDPLVFLPLVCLGIERLIASKRITLLTAALFFSFWSNFYMGYIVAVFSILYYLARVAMLIAKSSWKEYISDTLRFAAAGFLAFGMASALLVPGLFRMMEIAPIYDPSPDLFYMFQSVFDVIRNLFLYSDANLATNFNLYSGMAPLLLAAAYFFMPDISKREKRVSGVFLMVLYFSSQVSVFYMAWHMFDNPTGFPFRYSFVISFSVIVLALRAFSVLMRQTAAACRAVGISLAGMFLLLLCMNGLAGKEMPFFTYAVCLLLTAAWGALLWMRGTNRGGKALQRMLPAMMIALMASEILFSLLTQVGYFGFDSREGFADKEAAVNHVLADVGDPGLYRVGDEGSATNNDGMAFHYYAVDHHSSGSDYALIDFVRRVGFFKNNWPYIASYTHNPLTDSVFGVKYVIPASPGGGGTEYAAYTRRAAPTGEPYYVNPFALPLFFVSGGKGEVIPFGDQTVAENQRVLAEQVFGTADFYRVENPRAVAGEGEAVLVLPADGLVYICLPAGTDRFFVYADGVLKKEYAMIGDRVRMEPLGFFKEGVCITVSAESDAWVAWDQIQLAQLDMARLGVAAAEIQGKTASVTRRGDTVFEAAVSVETGERLFVTMPYSSGWALYEDDSRIPLVKTLSVLMGAELQPGEHHLRLIYTRPGGTLGLVISALSWSAFVLVCLDPAIRRRKSGETKGTNGERGGEYDPDV